MRSALKLGHARGVALLAASQASMPVVEYSPAEIKRAVVGYGRAEKQQVQAMVKLLLGLDAVPSPHDAADALAVAICHIHTSSTVVSRVSRRRGGPAARRSARGATIGPELRLLVIALLRGTLSEKTPSRLIVDVGGVGYDVLVPLSTFYVARRAGRRGDAPHPHARARGRASRSTGSPRRSSRICSSG